MRGRKPAGPGYVDHLEGSTETKRRLKVILQTMRGELRLSEACDILDVCPQRFHQLREEAMQGALQALEPRPIGRPPRLASPAEKEVEHLQQQLAEAKVELRTAQAREEIALVLPRAAQARVAQQPTEEKKTRRP